MTDKIEKTDAEWREALSSEQYHVTREAGTERAFSGQYWDCKQPGRYHCACCRAELFDSDAKYDSGTGWPSFYQPISARGGRDGRRRQPRSSQNRGDVRPL